MTGKLFIVGVGPGHHDHMTDRARWAIKQSDTIVGYETYVNLVKDLISGKDVYRYAMTQEVERAHQCIDLALSGKTVSLVSSGDPGIYGMAGLIYEVLANQDWDPKLGLPVEVIPGVSALNSCASIVGSPLMTDFAVVSMSDLLVPWEIITKRVEAAALGDFVIVIYNPSSIEYTNCKIRRKSFFQNITKCISELSVRASIVRELRATRKHVEYWTELVKFARHMPLARTMRALTIMGRSETENTDLAKLLYPAMQAMDIRFLDVDVAHSGMDQRKIHMLVRDVFPKMGWKVPVAVHHSLLPGLSKPAEQDAAKSGKMSKSNPDSGIFMHDDAESIRSKIKKAWCESGMTEANPLLEIARQIIFHENKEITVERPEKFGGNVTYTGFEQMHADFANSKLHPGDLKETVSKYLIPIVTGLAQKFSISDEARRTILDRST